MADTQMAEGQPTEGGAGDTIRHQARETLDQVTETVRAEAASFVASARETANGELRRRKDQVTGTIHIYANLARKAGDDLDEHDQAHAARAARQAAEGLDGLTRSLTEQSPGEMLDAVRDFGRRHPAAFVAGSVAVGVALGRFARSSPQREDSPRFAALAPEPPAADPYDVEPYDAGAETGSEFEPVDPVIAAGDEERAREQGLAAGYEPGGPTTETAPSSPSSEPTRG